MFNDEAVFAATPLPLEESTKAPAPKLSQRDKAYIAIKRKLMLQQLPAGERMREPEWVERLGVNRSAVREALVCLGAEGWLDRGAQTGHFVPHLDEQEIYEIMEVRAALECVAIDRIIAQGRTSEQELSPLIEACDELEKFLQSGYYLGGVEADRAFHERLIQLAKSKRLSMIYSRSPLPMVYATAVGIDDLEAEEKNSVQEHRDIIEDLKHGDSWQAKEKLQAHLVGWSLAKQDKTKTKI